MAPNTPFAADLDLADALAFTRALTEEAAARAKTMALAGMNVSQKADGSLVTNVDRTIEQFLRDAITARYPGHAILGEEFGAADAAGDPAIPLWALDPVDGTTNLAHGMPTWCVSVGLVVGDTPVVGVVLSPLLGETFAGARGLGATLNGESLPPLPPGGPTQSEDTYAICSTSARTEDFSRLPGRLRILGSAALDVCYVAAGRLAGCQCFSVSLYDVAGALCIAGEVGGEAAWRSGKPWSPRALAVSGPHHDALITAPPETLAFVRERVGQAD